MKGAFRGPDPPSNCTAAPPGAWPGARQRFRSSASWRRPACGECRRAPNRQAHDDDAIVGFEVERVFLPRGEQDGGVGARSQRPAPQSVDVPAPEGHMQDRTLRNTLHPLSRARARPAQIDVAATGGVHRVSQRSGAQHRPPVIAVVRGDERVDFVEVVRAEPGRVRGRRAEHVERPLLSRHRGRNCSVSG